MNKISRKGFLKIAAAAAMSGVTAGALSACNAASGSTASSAASSEAASTAAALTYTPGTYEATAKGIQSDVKVSVTFSKDKIEDIVIDVSGDGSFQMNLQELFLSSMGYGLHHSKNVQ